jgi:selenocysteine lyase/cysteine desulfurase
MDDVLEVRREFPATREVAYLNTATVGLASRHLIAAYRELVDEWEQHPFDYTRAEIAGERSRRAVAQLIGAQPSDVAQISPRATTSARSPS